MYDSEKMVVATGSLTLTSGRVDDFEAQADERWIVSDILYKVTTTFAGATNTPKIKAGSTSDDDKLIDDQDLGAVSAGNTVYSLRKQFPNIWNDDTPLENGDTLRITITAAAGAGAAGVAQFWYVLRK